jgi:hypothetical protein
VMIFSSGQSLSRNIITSVNISPNPPRSGFIKYNFHWSNQSDFRVFAKLNIRDRPLIKGGGGGLVEMKN